MVIAAAGQSRAGLVFELVARNQIGRAAETERIDGSAARRDDRSTDRIDVLAPFSHGDAKAALGDVPDAPA